MPETITEELVFSSEAEKTKKLEEMQGLLDDGTLTDPTEIQKIVDAEIKEPESNSDDGIAPDPDPEPESESEVTPEPDADINPQEPPADVLSRFEIDEKTIRDMGGLDEYTDPNGRKRPYWTFKKPEDIVKSVVKGTKHIRYLEDQLLPQARAEAIDETKRMYDAKIADYEKRLENTGPIKPVEPVIKPEISVANTGDAQTKYQDALKTLQGIPDPNSDDYDVIEHNKAMNKAMMAQSELLTSVLDKSNQFDTFKSDYKKSEESRVADRKNRDAVERQEKEKTEARENYNKACENIDTYIEKTKIDPNGQKFNDMAVEAGQFNVKLAQLNTGKHSVTQEEVESAVVAFNNKVPTLMSRVNADSYAAKPRNYDLWMRMDQIDAMRTGWLRDKYTKKWTHRRDVLFPSIDSAAREFASLSGETDLKIRNAKAETAKQIAEAANKRDLGVVQIDESKSVAEGEQGALTEEQAGKIIAEDGEYGITQLISEYISGNTDRLDRHNKARQRLGLEPFNPEQLKTR